MRLLLALFTSLLVSIVTAAVALDPESRAPRHVVRINGEPRDAQPEADEPTDPDLWKRRGGGGGGGRGGGSSGGSKGGSGSGSRGSGSRGSSSKTGSSSSSGGSRGSSSSSSGKGTNTYSNSNKGGYSNGGTGPQPSYGAGGAYYGGGSKVPYSAGAASPSGMTARGPLSGSGIAFWPGFWPMPIYMYGPYAYHHSYHNKTSDEDEERQIICGCEQYAECMCDEIDDEDFWDDLIGDGDYDKLNKTLVNVAEVNGTTTITVNGTLPNGTTIHSDDPEDYEEYLTNAAVRLGQTLGLWPAVAAVLGAVFLL